MVFSYPISNISRIKFLITHYSRILLIRHVWDLIKAELPEIPYYQVIFSHLVIDKEDMSVVLWVGLLAPTTTDANSELLVYLEGFTLLVCL